MGDEIEFRHLPNLPKFGITRDGRIKGPFGKLLKPAVGGHGYYSVSYYHSALPTQYNVHVLVALAWIGPKPSSRHQVRHLDGNKLNNHADNLAWGTQSDNEIDKRSYGKDPRGEKHGMHKLTEAEVREIRRLHRLPMKQRELAEMFGVHIMTINGVVNRRSWRHVIDEEAA